MKVFDVVEAYIIGRTEEVADKYTVNEESLSILGDYCGVIDQIMNEWSGDGLDVDIVGENNLVVISITVSAMLMDIYHPQYFDLIDRAVALAVCNTEENDLRMDFTFPSVWDKV